MVLLLQSFFFVNSSYCSVNLSTASHFIVITHPPPTIHPPLYRATCTTMSEGSRRIAAEELIVDKNHKLGSGFFGTVYRGVCRGQDVAVKVFKPSLVETHKKSMIRELEILRYTWPS
jgi:hypothetical protein